jgi:hypothetical protein
VLDKSKGLCCASISSDDVCVGPESGDNPSAGDDDGDEKPIIYGEVAAWSSCIAAGLLLTMHMIYIPESRQQMRPRMLLVLLALDSLAGLFFGLFNSPLFFQDMYQSISSTTVFFLGYVSP